MIEKTYEKRLNKETQKQGQQWTNFWCWRIGGFYNDVASRYCEREGGRAVVRWRASKLYNPFAFIALSWWLQQITGSKP